MSFDVDLDEFVALQLRVAELEKVLRWIADAAPHHRAETLRAKARRAVSGEPPE